MTNLSSQNQVSRQDSEWRFLWGEFPDRFEQAFRRKDSSLESFLHIVAFGELGLKLEYFLFNLNDGLPAFCERCSPTRLRSRDMVGFQETEDVL